MTAISFTVFGIPQPQGSTRTFMAGGRPVITSSNKNLGQWRRLVADVAQKHAVMHDGPVWVQLEFIMPAPKSLPKKMLGKPCTKRPDIDKLERACLDAFTGIFYMDDSQVVDLWSRKFYTHPDDDPQPCIRVCLGGR